MKNIAEIMQALLDGKKITFISANPNEYCYLMGGSLQFSERVLTSSVFDAPEQWKIWKEPKKVWEPQGGEYYLNSTGTIYKGISSEPHHKFKTIEQAEEAAKLMNTYARLIAYINEIAPCHDKTGAGDFLYKAPSGFWYVLHTMTPGLGMLTMPKEVAEELCKKLDSGEVVF